jgi:hypothetical protein
MTTISFAQKKDSIAAQTIVARFALGVALSALSGWLFLLPSRLMDSGSWPGLVLCLPCSHSTDCCQPGGAARPPPFSRPDCGTSNTAIKR